MAFFAMAIACGALFASSAAQAGTGNGGLGYEAQGSAAGDDAAIAASDSANVGTPLRLRGTVTGAARGAAIEIQRLDSKLGWVSAVSTTAGAGGSFDVLWTPAVAERTSLRAIAGGGAAIRAASAIPSHRVSVYKSASATWYGPGLWGNRLACGKARLTRRLQGVAHKTLPCGTRVQIQYRGRTVTVPVVDRGPFRAGTTWDLTYATARALGFRKSDRIGALTVARSAARS